MNTDPLLFPVLCLALYGLIVVVGACWDLLDDDTQETILDTLLEDR